MRPLRNRRRLRLRVATHVKNTVKQVIVTHYEGDNSYTATSTLKTHTKKD